jgi:general secretion pathway protein N
VRVILILAALFALVWAALSQIPLGFALRQLPLNAMGVNWTQAEGTIWNGRLQGVYLNGQPVGDVDVALRPASLIMFAPEVEVKWGGAGGRGAGVLKLQGDVIEASDLRVEQRISALESLTPEIRAIGGIFRLSEGAMNIEGATCTSATGKLSADTLAIAARRFGREFSDLTGSLSCEDGALSIQMNGSGSNGDSVAIDAEATLYGRSRIEVVANTNDNDIETLLANAGFSRENGVWTFSRAGGPAVEALQ